VCSSDLVTKLHSLQIHVARTIDMEGELESPEFSNQQTKQIPQEDFAI